MKNDFLTHVCKIADSAIFDSNKRLEEYILGSLRKNRLETVVNIGQHKDGIRVSLQGMPSVYADFYLDGETIRVELSSKAHDTVADTWFAKYAKFAGIPEKQAENEVWRFVKWYNAATKKNGQAPKELQSMRVSDGMGPIQDAVSPEKIQEAIAGELLERADGPKDALSKYKHYMDSFPKEPDYNIAAYGAARVGFPEIREFYRNLGAKGIARRNDDALWLQYRKDVGAAARSLVKRLSKENIGDSSRDGLKVGDKVRFTERAGSRVQGKEGEVVVVNMTPDNDAVAVRVEGHTYPMRASWCEKISDSKRSRARSQRSYIRDSSDRADEVRKLAQEYNLREGDVQGHEVPGLYDFESWKQAEEVVKKMTHPAHLIEAVRTGGDRQWIQIGPALAPLELPDGDAYTREDAEDLLADIEEREAKLDPDDANYAAEKAAIDLDRSLYDAVSNLSMDETLVYDEVNDFYEVYPSELMRQVKFDTEYAIFVVYYDEGELEDEWISDSRARRSMPGKKSATKRSAAGKGKIVKQPQKGIVTDSARHPRVKGKIVKKQLKIK